MLSGVQGGGAHVCKSTQGCVFSGMLAPPQ
jgi:hypothetical protein